jgi:hypothetical protein
MRDHPLHLRFAVILPRIEHHARIVFRQEKCPGRRADRIAEVVGLCWKWFVRLDQCGKDGSAFPSRLADYAARAVRSGRRVCGQEKAKDALSPRAQQRHGFYVGKLPDVSTESANPLTEALTDNTVSPVPDQAAFRCDFPAWRKTHTARHRRLIDLMLRGERTQDLAQQFGTSESRISQLRREFLEDWLRFIDA